MNPFRITSALVLVMALTAVVAVAQEEGKELPFKEQFAKQLDEWLPGLGAEKIQDRQDSQQKLQAICFSLGTPGREADRAEACRVIAGKLPEGNSSAKIWMLKQLEYIGRGECLDAVAKLMDDPDAHVCDSARRCLENNPGSAANSKLLAKLSAAKGTFRVGVVNSLGARGDKASVPALAGLLWDQDQAAATAAASALGKIGGPEAAGALKAAMSNASDALKVRIADAYLRCADKMLDQGKTDADAAIYSELDSDESPRAIRMAALKGKLNSAGNKAGDMILDLLESDDEDVQAIAASHVENVVGSGAMRSSPEKFAKLPASGQLLLLSALAATADRSAMPLAVEAANGNDPNVKLAALRALGTLGDASVVGLLVETLAAGGDLAGAARESLERLIADRVNDEIVSRMQKGTDAGLRGQLIDILDRRSATTAVRALLGEAAEHGDQGVRSRAMRALGNVAEPEYAADMTRILLKIPKGRERDDAEKAIVQVSGRILEEENRAQPVLSVTGGASDEDKVVLLPLVGRIGGRKALDAIHAALKNGNQQVRDAAVRGLCNWPDASVADELLEMANSSDNRSWRVWALRAYVRVVTLPSDRADRETLAMLKGAMELATQDDERRLVLARASTVRNIETLRWIVPYLDNDNPSIAQAACQGVVELAHHRGLREPNKQEFAPALKRVTEISQNRGLVERAKRYQAGL